MPKLTQPTWRKIQQQSFTELETLCDFLRLSGDQRAALATFSAWPILIPYRLAEKMSKGSLDDPLLRQFLPFKHENQLSFDFLEDPLEENDAQITPHLLKKYEGRALLLCTKGCAMHCRFCFRQHNQGGVPSFKEELAAIEADKTVREVILSGGDPLSLSNERLEPLLQNLDLIPHLQRIRIHTRFPIGIPERIDKKLLSILAKICSQMWFVTHINHPLELDDEVKAALKKIQKLGIPVLNQSVLLHGVNDSQNTLLELCEKLAGCGIVPYYLHQLDRVQGAAHFEVDEKVGKELVAYLSANCSGYAVPRFVKEEPKACAKTPLHSLHCVNPQ